MAAFQRSSFMKKTAGKTQNSGKARKGTRVSPKNKRSSVENAKGRSQRSVKSAERRSTGGMDVALRTTNNASVGKPRSQRLHPGKARKNQGVGK